MKAIIGALALVFCVNAAATFGSAEKTWQLCAPLVREEAQERLSQYVDQATNPTLTGVLGSTYDIHTVGGDPSTVESTTFYTLHWTVAAEGTPKAYSTGEYTIRAVAVGSECQIVK